MTGQLFTGRSVSRPLFRVVLLIALLSIQARCLFATSCSVVSHGAPSDADKALLAADFAKAVGLYQAELAKHPGDAALTTGLVHALLRAQKVQEAADAVKVALATNPKSAALITLRGEVEYRQGTPWLAADSAVASVAIDPCNPRTQLLLADLARINSLYATSRRALNTAHQLDPEDPEIRGEWLGTLPLKQRMAEVEAYLAEPRGLDEEGLRHWHQYLERLQKLVVEPHKSCRLVSQTAAAEIPFTKIMRDGTHIRAFGLDVKLNNRSTHLEIDTGAGGLLITRSVAEHAGLKPFSETEMSGIGDQGYKPGYTAFADSIHIGDLEFQNCSVRVLDSRSNLQDVDGLIGMDVFGHFLVTLDYPMRKLILGPLPKRPEDVTAPAPSLNTNTAQEENEEPPEDSAKKESQEKPAASDGASTPAATVPASTAGPTPAGTASPTPAKPAAHGPYNRYIALEMKDYTPVYRVGHDLIIPAELNGDVRKLFIVDTGAWTTTISPDAAREVTKVHSNDQYHVRGISGDVNKVYSADEVTFEFAHLSQKVRDVVAFDTSKVSKHVGMQISGFIGANTLRLLTIHIDYRDGLVKFDYDPNRGYKF